MARHHGDVASIERRLRGDGTTAYRVVWRDPMQPGRQSMTFDDRRQAEQTVKLLDANGQRLSLAVEVANAIRQGGPTVSEVVSEHIDLLNRVGEDTRSGYRLRARDHIDPHLGALPVKALTWQIVTRWVRELQEKGLAPKSIANVHGLLSAAMNTAVRLGYRQTTRAWRCDSPAASEPARRWWSSSRTSSTSSWTTSPSTTGRSSWRWSAPGCGCTAE